MLKLQTLVVYDISDTKVRTKIAESCLDFGLERIQKSAFRGMLNSIDRKELFERLRRLLEKSSGRILLIPLCENDWNKALTFEQNSDEYPAQKSERPTVFFL